MQLYCPSCCCSVSRYTTLGGEEAYRCNNPRCGKVVALAVAHEALLSRDEVAATYARIQARLTTMEGRA